MDFLFEFFLRFFAQLQTPTLGFLFGGMILCAFGSKLAIPNAIYQFVIFILLMKIGLQGGIELKNAEMNEIFFPLLISAVLGFVIVAIGHFSFSLMKVKREDGIATAGLFGAVSASTLAAAIIHLEQENIFYESWVPALYPIMDITALVFAIILSQKAKGSGGKSVKILPILKDSLQGSALSALLLGLALGLLSNTAPLLENFYRPLFGGFLSILMLIMGMEAYSRLHELKKVAHWFVLYALVAPVVHGFIAFALGYVAHLLVGFHPGGVILLAVMAASSSDISGPPTLRSAIPKANPAAYIGSSTSLGTPVAIAICIPLFTELSKIVFN